MLLRDVTLFPDMPTWAQEIFLPRYSQVTEEIASIGTIAGGGVIRISSGEPTSGTDVMQLEESLIELGYDANGSLIADGIYSIETTLSILNFQKSVGQKEDGIINLGDVVFLPGDVRVTDQISTKGSNIGPGSPILEISLSPKVVRVDLPANKQGIVAVGNTVVVELPDFTEVPARVISVAQTATSSGPGPATFDVLIELDDPTPAEALDEAPVEVTVISDSVKNVMAVPVSALLALLEGGYAVELMTDEGATSLVPVEVGFFGENGMVEITSSILKPGNRVVIP